MVQGKKKVADKDYKRAIALFSEALIQEPQNTDAKFYRAISQLDSGLLAEAVSELKDILDMRSNHSPVCHILLSIAYKRLNN